MAVVRCPGCRAELDVADRLLAEPVACGACGAVFDPSGGPPPVARRVDDDLWDRRRDDDDDFDDEYDRPPRPDATPAYLPGLLSVVVCVVSILLLVGDIAVMLAFPQAVQNNPLLFGQPAPPVELMIGFRVFALVWLLVVLTAGFRMMSGRSHRFAVAGMILQLFPCSGLCYPFGLAVGVWALVVLHRPEVRAGFAPAESETEGVDR